MPLDADHHGAGEVVELRSRRRYAPDLRGLASGQVASAREKLGLTPDEFAALLGSMLDWRPSADLVETWETSVVPPGDVLLAAAIATQDTPGDVLTFPLGPGAERTADVLAAIGPAIGRSLDSDVVKSYATRGDIARGEWNKIIAGSTNHLWLYGMAEFGYAADDQVPGIIAQAVEQGCDVRVLLLDPDFPGVADIDAEEGNPAGTLVPRVRAALGRFAQMRTDVGPGMQLRVYNAHPTASIVRGDDRMLVTPYVRFFIGSNSPTFELSGAEAGSMFDRYARHVEHAWESARDWAT